MRLLSRFLLAPYLMLRDAYFSGKYAKTQFKAVNFIIKDGVANIKTDGGTFKDGRQLYAEIHGENDFLHKSTIESNTLFAKILAVILIIYWFISIAYLDIFGFIFGILAYYVFIVVYFQYSLWMNYYKCIIPFKLYAKKTWDKEMWIWFLNDKYKGL